MSTVVPNEGPTLRKAGVGVLGTAFGAKERKKLGQRTLKILNLQCM